MPQPGTTGRSQWFFESDGKKSGPLSSQQLRELAEQGRIQPTTLVWRNGLENWVEAGRVKGLFGDAPVRADTAAAVSGIHQKLPATAAAQSESDKFPPGYNATGDADSIADAPPSSTGASSNMRSHSLKRALHEVAVTCGLVFFHLVLLVRMAAAAWKRRSLENAAYNARLSLGEQLYRSGHGDQQLRQQIAELDDRIESLKQGKGSTKQPEAERRGLLIRLASQTEPSPGAAEYHSQMEKADRAVAEHDQHLVEKRKQLWPSTIGQKVRLGAGYGIAALMLCGLMFAVLAGSSSDGASNGGSQSIAESVEPLGGPSARLEDQERLDSPHVLPKVLDRDDDVARDRQPEVFAGRQELPPQQLEQSQSGIGRGHSMRTNQPPAGDLQPRYDSQPAAHQPANQPAQQQPDVTWSDPEKAAGYILIGADLWNIETGELVTKSFSNGSTDLRLVKDAPGKLFDAGSVPGFGIAQPPTQRGFATAGRLFDYSSGRRATVAWQGAALRTLTRNSDWKHLAADFRRVAFLEGGDIWRAEFDWQTGELVDKQRITKSGQFSSTQPLLWSGNQLFLWGGFSQERPVVRVDLQTGGIDEIGTKNVFAPTRQHTAASFATDPDTNLVYRASFELLHLYDVAADTALIMDNVYPVEHWAHGTTTELALVGSEPNSRGTKSHLLGWTDDQTVVIFNEGLRGAVAAGLHPPAFVRLDLVARTVAPLAVFNQPPPQPQETASDEPPAPTRSPNARFVVRLLSVIDGTRYADVAIFNMAESVAAGVTPTATARWLLDLQEGDRIELPRDLSAAGIWIDDERFLYSQGRGEGGLDAVGTWIYDRTEDDRRKIFHLPADLPTIDRARTSVAFVQQAAPPNVLVLSEREQVVFSIARDFGSGIYQVNLDGSGGTKLTDGNYRPKLSRIHAAPIDLGFGKDAVSPWKEPISAASSNVGDNEPATDTTPQLLSGYGRVLVALQDQPTEIRDFGRDAYMYCAADKQLPNFYDPACAALQVTKKRVELAEQVEGQSFNTQFATLFRQADLKQCVDRDRLIRYAADTARRARSLDFQKASLSPQQIREYCVSVGESFAEQFVRQPIGNANVIGRYMTNAYLKCDRELQQRPRR